MHNRKLIVLVLLLLLVVLPSVRAQDVTDIQYGDTLEGEINDPDDAVFYVFEGEEGDVIDMFASSDDIDVYLQLGRFRWQSAGRK